jgi:MOSC domain-containing protein YiiM
MTPASVVSVSRDSEHRFSKPVVDDIVLVAGLGVEGDAHAGTTVQHRSRVARDPSQPNLRQVHLVHAELFDEVGDSGFEVAPGELGENVTTRGVDLLGLPRGAVLRLGPDAVVEITGLRNPCVQIDGLAHQTVMAVVLAGGRVAPGDGIAIELPAGEHEGLQPV